jgi:hypothetical protein
MTGHLPDPRKVHLTNEQYDVVIGNVIANITAANSNLTALTIVKLKNELLHEIYDYEVIKNKIFIKLFWS